MDRPDLVLLKSEAGPLDVLLNGVPLYSSDFPRVEGPLLLFVNCLLQNLLSRPNSCLLGVYPKNRSKTFLNVCPRLVRSPVEVIVLVIVIGKRLTSVSKSAKRPSLDE